MFYIKENDGTWDICRCEQEHRYVPPEPICSCPSLHDAERIVSSLNESSDGLIVENINAPRFPVVILLTAIALEVAALVLVMLYM